MTAVITALLVTMLVLAAVFGAAVAVGWPRDWYRWLRYGNTAPVIEVDVAAGTVTARGFRPGAAARVTRSVYLVPDVYPPCDGAALTLLCCPRDLMSFLVTNAEEDGLLIDHRRRQS